MPFKKPNSESQSNVQKRREYVTRMSATDSHLAAHEQRVVKCSVGETTPKGDWHLIYQLGKGGNGVVFLVRQGSRLRVRVRGV